MQIGSRRCDAVCHDAKGKKCTCVCSGKFHGANVRRDDGARKDIEEILYWKKAAKAKPAAESDNQPELDFGGRDAC